MPQEQSFDCRKRWKVEGVKHEDRAELSEESELRELPIELGEYRQNCHSDCPGQATLLVPETYQLQ